ncbi:MAG: DUF1302 family protein [Acidobacteriota bacterium]
MLTRKKSCGALVFLGVMLGLSGAAHGMFADKDQTIQVGGKIQTRFSIRTDDSSGFTFPEVSAGDWVQWRNIAYVEVTHDLRQLMDKTWLLMPFRAAGLNVRYHLVGRFLYEGIYDFGPEQFQDVREADEDAIDDFKKDADLWEAYADFVGGPVFLRIGKQNLSWGETDGFRLLDLINPLDNTFGGIFEDLDDRRIPIMLLRGAYNFGDFGPFGTVTLESFWNPTFMDDKVAPLAPFGTVYAVPAPAAPAGIGTRIIGPEENMDGSRYGFRLQWVMASNFNFSVAHYRSYPDGPALRLVLDPGPVQEIVFPDVNVTGGTLSFFVPPLGTVVRSEVAYTWDQPVFIPEENAPLLVGVPQSGRIPTKRFFSFCVGLDKQIWIRPLNKKSMFFLSAEYFGQWYPDFDERMRVALPVYPSGQFETIKRLEQNIVFAVSNNWHSGLINPQFTFIYDPRGAYLVQPQVTFIHEPLRLTVQWSAINGEFHGIGAFRDRDQVSFILTALF